MITTVKKLILKRIELKNTVFDDDVDAVGMAEHDVRWDASTVKQIKKQMNEKIVGKSIIYW